MADKTDDLIISISTDTANIRRQLKKLESDIAGTTNRVEREFSTMGKKIDASMSRLATTIKASIGSSLKGWAGAAAGIITVAEITKAADAYTNLGNRLRALGVEGEGVARTQNEIVAIAMRARAPLEGVGQLYTRLLSTTAELGVSQAAVGVATETITKGFILSGTAAAEASSASRQFSQALASGVLRGDEFNSIMENAPPIAKAIAAEFGVNVSALREMAEAGELVADRVFNAIIKSAPDIERAFSTSIPTVDQALSNLGTSLATIVGKMDQAVGASGRVAQAFQAMAGIINGLAISDPVAAAQGQLAETQRRLNVNTTGRPARGGMSAAGVTELRTQLAADEAALEKQVVARIDAVATAAIEAYGGGAQDGLNFSGGIAMPGAPTPTARPADLGKRQKKAGGAKVPRRDADDRFTADIQAVRDRTAALAAEQQMIGQGAAVQESRRVALELEQSALYDLREEARRKGETDLASIELAPEQIAAIKQVADAYGQQTAALGDARQTFGDINDMGRSALGGFVSDLRQGTSAAEALSNALDGVLDKMLDMALNSLFDAGGGGGVLGALFGGLATGGSVGAGGIGHAATGGGIRGRGTGTSDSIPMMLSNGEFVVRASQARKFGPLLDAINSGRIGRMASGGPVGVPNLPSLSGRGGGPITIGGTSIVVQGSVDDRVLRQMRGELDARDARLAQQMKRAVPGIGGSFQQRGA